MPFKIADMFPDVKPEVVEALIIDRSTAEDYAECPFRGSCVLDGDKDEAGEIGQIGQEGHRIAEKILKEAFSNKVTDDLLTYADDAIQEVAQSRPDIQPQLIKSAKYLAEQIAHVPIDRILTDKKGKPFIEYQIDYNFGKTRDGRDVVITTCIDLAFSGQNSIHVWDWKFGWKKYTGTDAQEAYQTCHICYILFQMFPDIDVIHFWYKNTRYGSSGYACIRRSEETPSMPNFTTEQAFLCRINSAIQLIADNCKEAWPEEKKCLWCPVNYKCPHLSKALTGIPIDPKALVDQIVVLQTWLKKHEKTATELYRKDGPLKGTKHTWEWKPTKIVPRLCELETKDETEVQQ